MQNIAKPTYREILERRAKENGVDFVNGVATAITPMAFFETVMAKGYETLVDSDTKVDVNTGMIAAGRLQALMDSRASGTSMVDMWVKMNRIINAIHSTVPEELWPEILCKLDGDETQSGGRGRNTFEPDTHQGLRYEPRRPRHIQMCSQTPNNAAVTAPTSADTPASAIPIYGCSTSLLAWSRWRRRHQYRARQSHYRRREHQ